MGIRLSYRKKNIESEERCLGKLFSYLERDTDADACKCISYLVSIGAIDQLLDEFDDLKEYGKNEKFEVICCISHEIKTCLFIGRKAMTNLDGIY